jgi:hypothetical protein
MTTDYESFRIAKAKYLGKLDKPNIGKDYHIIEEMNEQVEYIKLPDIHKSEKDAEIALMKILASKHGYNLSN